MNREVSTVIVVITMGIMTILSVIDNKISSDRIIDEIRNNKCMDLEKRLEAMTDKKNILYLIALERGKSKPNKHLLDSLEVSYGLDY